MNKFIKRICSAIAIGCAGIAVIGTATFLSEVLGMKQSKKTRKSCLTKNEMLAIVKAGGHEGDKLGNILAFAFSNSKKTVPLVLCSQMLPPDSTRNVSNAIPESFRSKLPIANAVHWVAFLALGQESYNVEYSHEELREQSGKSRMKKRSTNQKKQEDGRHMPNEEVIKWLNGERQEYVNNFVREVSDFVDGDGLVPGNQKAAVLKYYDALREYIGIFGKVATKSGVMRPRGGGGGCIVSKEGYEATIAFIDAMIGRLRDKKAISEAERLMSVGKNPNGPVDEAYRLVPDYIQHASHTEAQLYVLKNAFFEDYAIKDLFIASTKLPC